MTPETLAEVEKACEEASPAPWTKTKANDDGMIGVAGPDGKWVLEVYSDWPEPAGKDAHFIANARQWVPELLLRVRELEAEKRGYEIALRAAASTRQDYSAQMVAAEREECARLVEPGPVESKLLEPGAYALRRFLASAIRARKP